ncbi:MAG: YtxH domain-containing protein [Bacteroidales bacterium]
MSNSSSTLVGIVAGAALGFVAGILLAPEKGEDTRKKIGDKAKHLKDEMDKKMEDVNRKIHDLKHNFESHKDAGQA